MPRRPAPPLPLAALVVAGASLLGARQGEAATLRGTVVYPTVHEDADARPGARKPLGAWRLENGRLRIAAEADVRRDVVLALEPQQPVAVDAQPLTVEARPGGVLEPRITLAANGVIVTWKNADQGPRVVTLEDGDTLLPPEPAAPGATREVRFTISGEYVFLDPEHPFARALVVVTGTPYVTRADDKGGFSLEAPDGRYRLKAWWRGRWTEVAQVELGPRGHEPVTVRLGSDGAERASAPTTDPATLADPSAPLGGPSPTTPAAPAAPAPQAAPAARGGQPNTARTSTARPAGPAGAARPAAQPAREKSR